MHMPPAYSAALYAQSRPAADALLLGKPVESKLSPMVSTSQVKFFLERMEGHSCVVTCNEVACEDGGYIFQIERTRGLPAVKVYISDAYDYGYWEYLSRPAAIGRGDFIFLTGFTSASDEETVDLAKKDGIGLGPLRKLMGALSYERVWEYKLPEERQVPH